MAEDPYHLRVLIADEEQRRVTEIADVISALGHSVVAQLLDVSEIAEATRRRAPRRGARRGRRPAEPRS